MRLIAVVLVLLSATSAGAQVPTPARPVTDPRMIVSPAEAAAKPVPIGDLGYSRGLLSAAWSADGKQLFLSTNLTGRYNIWRTDAAGSWPVQLTQADDRQGGLLVSQMARRSFSTRIVAATSNTTSTPFPPTAAP